MRRAPALLAAAALLFALGAPACKPSSLTPFGIGTREPENPEQNINGSWEGRTSSGFPVTFQVGDDRVLGLRLQHLAGSCLQQFEAGSTAAIVEENAFTLELFLEQGRILINGSFISANSCSGDFLFEGLPSAENCPTSGSGTFVAGKTR